MNRAARKSENKGKEKEDGSSEEDVGLQYISLTTLCSSVALLGVMVACMVLRTHLFIWTVFSPKYLYTMVWCLGQHLLVNVLGGLTFSSR